MSPSMQREQYRRLQTAMRKVDALIVGKLEGYPYIDAGRFATWDEAWADAIHKLRDVLAWGE